MGEDVNRLRLGLASVVAVAFVAGTSLVSQADPAAVEKARQELATIQQQASALDQEIIEASDRVTQAEAKLKTIAADVSAQEAKVEKLAAQLGEVASLQFHSDSFSVAAQLLTQGDANDFLNGLATMQREIDRSNTGVQQLQLDQAKLTTLREDAAATEAKLVKDREDKVKLAGEYDAKEKEAKAVYDRLSEEERQRLAAIEAERQRREEEAQRRAEQAAAREEAQQRASRSRDTAASPEARPTRSASPSAQPTAEKKTNAVEAPKVESGGSDRAQRAVEHALAQVGKRYVWGTSGPNTFDCSGLTSYAYRQVGISLSRSSRVQFSSAGRKVSKSELKPGDLVFYYSPVSHVGMYIGNGKIVHAANPRTGVNITSLGSMPFSGARRVVG